MKTINELKKELIESKNYHDLDRVNCYGFCGCELLESELKAKEECLKMIEEEREKVFYKIRDYLNSIFSQEGYNTDDIENEVWQFGNDLKEQIKQNLEGEKHE